MAEQDSTSIVCPSQSSPINSTTGNFLCVECGETFVESLFVEYDFQDRSKERGKTLTGSNIRLVRCSGNKCSGGKAQAQVADKYVEYEMILVLIDVILHRIPAFRHLLFNRYPPSSMKKSAKTIFSICVILSVSLKSFALQSYPTVFSVQILVALFASVSEMLVCIIIMVLSIWCLPSGIGRQLLSNGATNSRPHWTMSPLYIKIYLAIVGPELLKGIAIFLRLFDSEASLLLLCGLLQNSLQIAAIRALTGLSTKHIAVCVFCAAVCKCSVRSCFYNSEEVWAMGVIL
eukprot:gene28803-38083_t